MKPNRGRFADWPWWLLTVVSAIWLLMMTLRPSRYGVGENLNLIPLMQKSPAIVCLLDADCLFRDRAAHFLLIDLLGNIVVFIPLGLGLAGIESSNSWWRPILWGMLGGFLLSLTIELVQLTIPSRATDVDDLIFNTLGSGLGASLKSIYNLQLAILDRS